MQPLTTHVSVLHLQSANGNDEALFGVQAAGEQLPGCQLPVSRRSTWAFRVQCHYSIEAILLRTNSASDAGRNAHIPIVLLTCSMNLRFLFGPVRSLCVVGGGASV